VPLSTFGPQGYGLESVRDGVDVRGRVGSLAETGDNGKWREYGRYGRIVELVGARMVELDASGLQAQGLAHLIALLGQAGKLRRDKALYSACREMLLSTPVAMFAEVPFALSLTVDGLRQAGVADEELHRCV